MGSGFLGVFTYTPHIRKPNAYVKITTMKRFRAVQNHIGKQAHCANTTS